MAYCRDVGQHLPVRCLLWHRAVEPQHVEMAQGTNAQGLSLDEVIVRRIEHPVAIVYISQQSVDISYDLIEIVVEIRKGLLHALGLVVVAAQVFTGRARGVVPVLSQVFHDAESHLLSVETCLLHAYIGTGQHRAIAVTRREHLVLLLLRGRQHVEIIVATCQQQADEKYDRKNLFHS